MRLTFSVATPSSADLTVHFLAKEDRAKTVSAATEDDFSGAPHSRLYLHTEGLLYVGLGAAGKVDGQSIRSAAGTAAKFAREHGKRFLCVHLEDYSQFAQQAAEGVALGAYRFDTFKTPDAGRAEVALQEVTMVAPADVHASGERGCIVGEAINYAREMANQPGNLFHPESLAEAARRLAGDSGGALEAEVWDEARLRKEGVGGLLAVGGGSARPPRLIVLRYRGGAAEAAPLAIVGKSITFDSGGLSIKPADRMEEMVWDKCGGMATIGAMYAIAKLRPARNVVAILASAENLTGPNAYRPGDIVTIYDGKQIEIVNTDAEGRVVLADAIAYARKELKAAEIIDLATLTGACIVALGETIAGLWTSSDDVRDRLLAAADRAGERYWPMPLAPEHEQRIKSEVALIKNSGGRPGGACTAAAFLKTFVEDTPWAHIDLAGPSATTKDAPDLARGATGFGVRTLVEYVCASA